MIISFSMGLLKESDEKAVRERLSKLEHGVSLVVFTQEMECLFCRETRELIEEVAALPDKLSVEVRDFPGYDQPIKIVFSEPRDRTQN